MTHGYDGTSMDRIASVAAVSKRTVYNHFTTKEALFQEITEAQFGVLVQGSKAPAYDSSRALDDQLADYGHQLVALFSSESYLNGARLLLMERLRAPEREVNIEELLTHRESGLDAWIAAAVADGKLAVQHPLMAAQQFFALLKAFALWPQLFGTQSPLSGDQIEQVVDSAVKLFLHGYAAG